MISAPPPAGPPAGSNVKRGAISSRRIAGDQEMVAFDPEAAACAGGKVQLLSLDRQGRAKADAGGLWHAGQRAAQPVLPHARGRQRADDGDVARAKDAVQIRGGRNRDHELTFFGENLPQSCGGEVGA